MSDKTPKVQYSEEAGGLVSAVPLCADKDDNLVPCDDPRANTQVAAPGVAIPPKLAKRYGLSQAKGKREEAAEEEEEAEPKRGKVLGEDEPSHKERSLKVSR